jgi:hypothetical protein
MTGPGRPGPVIHFVEPPEKLRIGLNPSRVDRRDEPSHDGEGGGASGAFSVPFPHFKALGAFFCNHPGRLPPADHAAMSRGADSGSSTEPSMPLAFRSAASVAGPTSKKTA